MNPYQKFAVGLGSGVLFALFLMVACKVGNQIVQLDTYDNLPYIRTSNEVIVIDKYTSWYGSFIKLSGTWKKEHGPWSNTRNTDTVNVPKLFLDYVEIGEVIRPGDLSIHDFIRQRILDKSKD